MKNTVEIAGAGIAGLTTGLAFAQRGWRVRVHEQNRALRNLDDGIFIWENGLRVLDALGVLPQAIAGAIGADRQERRNYDGATLSISRLGESFRLYAVPRRNFLTTLHDALVETGGEVVFGSRAVAAEPDGWLHFANGSSQRADLIVAADGVDSSIRDSLGLLRCRRPANQFGYRAVIPLEPDEFAAEPAHCEYWNGAHRLLLAPCTAGLACVELTAPAGEGAGSAVPIDRGFWRSLFPDLSGIVERIPEDGRSGWFEDVRLENWSSGKVAIVGDAASAQPPLLGHGAGCSIMSAFALAQTVDLAGDVIDGLAEWEMRERPFTDWVQWVAYWYSQLAFLPTGARTAVFKAADASAWVKRRILLAAVCRDVTAIRRYSPAADRSTPIFPLIH